MSEYVSVSSADVRIVTINRVPRLYNIFADYIAGFRYKTSPGSGYMLCEEFIEPQYCSINRNFCKIRRIAGRLAFLITVCLVQQAAAGPQVTDVRIGVYPGKTRVVWTCRRRWISALSPCQNRTVWLSICRK